MNRVFVYHSPPVFFHVFRSTVGVPASWGWKRVGGRLARHAVFVGGGGGGGSLPVIDSGWGVDGLPAALIHTEGQM